MLQSLKKLKELVEILPYLTQEQNLQGHSDYVLAFDYVLALCVLPNGQLASGSNDKTIRLWDIESGTCVKTLQGHSDYVRALCVLPNGQLASGSDNIIQLHNIESAPTKIDIQSFFSALSLNEIAYTQHGLRELLQGLTKTVYSKPTTPAWIETWLYELGNFWYTPADEILSQQQHKVLSPKVQARFIKAYLEHSLLAFTLLGVSDNKISGLIYQIINNSLLKRDFISSETISKAYIEQLTEAEQQKLIGITGRLLEKHYQLLAGTKDFNPVNYFKYLEGFRKNSWLAELSNLTFYQMAAALAIQADFCSLQVFEDINHVAVYLAILANNTAALEAILPLQPALLTMPVEGWMPALIAAKYGNQQVLYWLLANTDNSIHDVGPNQETIWQVLEKHGHKGLHQKLNLDASGSIQKAFAYVKENDLANVKQLHYTFEFDINQKLEDTFFLFEFIRHKNAAALEWASIVGINFKATNKAGKSPSIVAVESNWIEGVQCLHQLGKEGACLLHEAVKLGDMELLQFSIDKAKLNVNQAIENGDTALILAVKYNRQDMLLYLLQHQADINYKNAEGETAAMVAMRPQHSHLTAILHLYANPAMLQALQSIMPINTGYQQFGLFATAAPQQDNKPKTETNAQHSPRNML